MKLKFFIFILSMLMTVSINVAHAAKKKPSLKKVGVKQQSKFTKFGRTGDRHKAQAMSVSKLTKSVVQSPSRAPAGLLTGSQEVDKPLKVQGQSRNLSMMLMLKKEKDKIKFGEIRENYNYEISKTNF